MVFIVFNLGILGDNLPINTNYIGLKIRISHRGVRWDRGTSVETLEVSSARTSKRLSDIVIAPW